MPAAPPVLPARRADLIFKPLGDDGHNVVKDPRTGAYFKLGPQESFLFTRLDGRHGADELCRDFSRHFGEPLAGEDLREFLTLAAESGFLAASRSAPSGHSAVESGSAPAATSRPGTVAGNTKRIEVPPQARRSTALPTARTPAPPAEPAAPKHAAPEPVAPDPAPPQPAKTRQSILYWRKSVFDPDALFNRLEPRLRFLWTRAFFVASVACIVAAATVSWLNRRELVSDFPLAWAARGEVLLLAWLTLVVATTLHEFAHGLTCKHFGGEVHEVGFLLMFFLPCFYCNVSDAWLFREKSKRLWVTLAGGWCDLCLWSAAVFVWRLTPADTLPHYLAWLLMGVAGARVFFNFNPLLKLDGYYLLSDAVEMPNLRQRGWDRFMAHLRWLLWGARRPESEPRGRFLFLFGLAAWTYSVLFLGLMVVGFTHWWGQSWGAVGAIGAIALGLVMARGAVGGLSQGEVSQMLTSRTARVMGWTACLAALAAAAFVVPVQDRAAGPFRLRAARRAEIRAPLAGFLQSVQFDEGQKVAAGATVLRIEVPDLETRIDQLEARGSEAQAELELLRAGLPGSSPAIGDTGETQFWRIRAASAQVDRLREEQWYLRAQRLKQSVTSPVAGTVITPRLREKIGQYFKEGELICEVEDTSSLEAEVSVPEQEVARVRPGQRVHLKARAAPFDSLMAEVTRVASTAKDPAASASGPGGAPAVSAAPGIGDVPGHVVVYCTVSAANAPKAVAAVRPGMTGHARIDCGSGPVGKVIALRLLRYVRTEFWW